MLQMHSKVPSPAVLMTIGWSGRDLSSSMVWRAGTAMLPSSVQLSRGITVRRVSSESEAVISSCESLITKRKFSRIGREVFAGMAFETSIMLFSRLALDTLNSIFTFFGLRKFT